jgi:hypothetical protein
MSGNRKITFSFLVILLLSVLCYFDKMGGSVLVEGVVIITLAVITGNVVSKFSPESKIYAEGVKASGDSATPGVQP